MVMGPQAMIPDGGWGQRASSCECVQ